MSLWTLNEVLGTLNVDDVRTALAQVPPANLVLALALTFAAFTVMTLTDWLAFRYVDRTVPLRRVLQPGFIGYAFSQTIGLSLLTGGSVRYRLYSPWGVSAGEVTRMVLFLATTAWVGLLTLAGLVFAFAPPMLPDLPAGTEVAFRAGGVLLLAAVTGFLVLSRQRDAPVRILGWELPVPGLPLAGAQVGISAARWGLTAAVLFALLPEASVGFPAFFAAYVAAEVLGRASHVPGGFGVFEAALVVLLTPGTPLAALVGALVLYRGVYYVLPLLVASLLLAVHEVRERRAEIARGVRLVGPWVPRVMPTLLAVTTFVGGALLLFTGSLPERTQSLVLLAEFLPPSVIEASHLLASLVGALLVLLARGLQQRLDAAYYVSLLLLGAGSLLALLRGLDWVEASVLAVAFAALLPARSQFHRRASLVHERFTPAWTAAVILVLAGSAWLGLFVYGQVPYRELPFWRLALFGDAPPWIRALVGAGGITLVWAAWHLLSPPDPEPELPDEEDLDAIAPLVARADRADAHLAFLGDKSFLRAREGASFLMYAVSGRSWVTQGGVVTTPETEPGEASDLLWRFQELADRHGGRVVLHDVRPRDVPDALDLGLALLTIGEAARVPLAGFDLEAPERAGLRATRERVGEAGVAFEVMDPGDVAPLLPELTRVDRAWRQAAGGREKGFSMGSSRERYLRRCPLLLARRGDEVVGFAMLWPGGGDGAAVDVLRVHPDAPEGLLDALVVEAMAWARDREYRWFDLGTAPIVDGEHRAEDLWRHVATTVYRHGEHFRRDADLRAWKASFGPAWEPRYLAASGGLALPTEVKDVVTLVTGGWATWWRERRRIRRGTFRPATDKS